MAFLTLLLIAFFASNAAAQTVLPRCIIGAGAAGLGAGSGLPTDRPVIVFEARDRVGGRVFTDNSLGFSIDLGAGWIQGGELQNRDIECAVPPSKS
jgi:monoamine oxidase